MWQIDGEKGCILTWGGFIGRRKQIMKPIVTTNYEKSAGIIVPRWFKTQREGLNFKRCE